MKRVFTYIPEEKYINRPIKDVLKNKYNMSSALISSLKKKPDGILVNGIPKFVTYALNEYDILKITITEGASQKIKPIPIPIDIVYEDEDILAVNKPGDMPTHTSFGHLYDTLANGVLHYLNKNCEEHTFHAVTRLDRDTSGLVLIAKNRYAHDLFSELIREKKIKKNYIAAVCGKPEKEGKINLPIARTGDSIIKREVNANGKDALTLYKLLSTNEKYSLASLEIPTGRTHQIRVHMSHLGFPLVGDALYGGEEIASRQLLHCTSLSFFHPILKRDISLTAPMPQDMQEFCLKEKLI